MDFYITDRTFQLKTITSTNGDTPFKVISAEDVSTLETSSRRMTMEISFTPTTTDQAKEFFKVGNYVLYVDLNGKYEWMTILKATHNPLTQVRTLECEDAGLDLLNETVSTYKADKAYNVAYYINKFTHDSGFKIGINEISNLTRKLEWEGEATALERIQSVATQFDNAEIEFRFDFSGNELAQRYIDIKKKRGTTDFHRMYVNRDIHSIVVEEDIYDLVNAIYATGGTPEGKDEPINLKGHTWTDKTGRFVLDKKEGIIRDTHNIKQWSRTNTNSHYFLQYRQFETTNKNTLVNNVISHLKKYSVPVVNYIVDIANIPDLLQVGDTVELVDENEQLYLSSRVQELTFRYHEGTCEAVLSEFMRLSSGIAEQLRDIKIDISNETVAKVNSVPKVYVQQTEPDKPKEGDIWWVQEASKEFRSLELSSLLEKPPMISAYKVYKDNTWQDQTIDQSVLNIETLNAVNINGSVINGSEFINTWDKKESIIGGTARRLGSTTIGEGSIKQDNNTYVTVTGGAELLRSEENTLIQYGRISNMIKSYDIQTGTTIENTNIATLSDGSLTIDTNNYKNNTSSNTTIGSGIIGITGARSGQPYANTRLDATGITVNGKKQFGSFYGIGPNLNKQPTDTLLRVGPFMGTDFNTSKAEHDSTIIFNPNRDVMQFLEGGTYKFDINLRHQGDGTSNQSKYVYTNIVMSDKVDDLKTKPGSGYVGAVGSYAGTGSLNLRFIGMGSSVLDVPKNYMVAFRIELENSKYSFITSIQSLQITKVFR
ncbi:tail assembly protein [Enterococcus phage phiNASRA1]|nr:tail assembly protein [Enterococcus phage phiNASRA1]